MKGKKQKTSDLSNNYSDKEKSELGESEESGVSNRGEKIKSPPKTKWKTVT